MRNRLFVCFGLAAALLTFSGATFAHHGSVVSYDTNKMITAEGTVTEFRWRNPHVYVMYDVKDAEGNIVNWGAETHSPIVCENQDGWTKSTLKPGDKITISVFPSKIGTSRGLLAKIVLSGKVIIDDTGRGAQVGQQESAAIGQRSDGIRADERPADRVFRLLLHMQHDWFQRSILAWH